MGHMVGRAQVHVDGGPLGQRGGVRQQPQARVDAAAGLRALGGQDPVAAPDGVAVDAGEVERAALAGTGGGAFAVLGVDAAQAHRAAGGRVAQRVAHAGLAREDGAGDHGALAGQGEHPVHRQAEQAAVLARGGMLRGGDEVGTQRGGARVVCLGGGGGEDRGAG